MGILSGCVEEEQPPVENNPPVAGFTFDIVNLTVTFTDTSTDTDGNITTWSWDFGDEIGTSTEQSPVYTYTEDNKTYSVILTVTDDDGDTDDFSADVTIGTPPVPPTAAFDYDPMINITVNETIEFMDNSTEGSANITGWLWDFGDGTNSTEQNPEHNYSAADTYTVTLTVTDANGEEDIATAEIIVTEEEA
jgi:PKD repeat protein